MARLRGHSGLTDRGLVRGASAPSSAAIGQLWFNTGTGVLYQYTNDGASSFWLDISSGGIGSSISEGVDFVGDTDPIKSTNGTGLAVGSVYLNREKNRYFVCTNATTNSNVWSGRYSGNGGTISEFTSGTDNYRVHIFTSVDKQNFYIDETTLECDMLIVGGGGGGGNYLGGGGGGGEVLYVQSRDVTYGTYSIQVGAGGMGGKYNQSSGTQGIGSYFGSDYATTNLYARPGGAGSGHGTGAASEAGTHAGGTASVEIVGTGNGGGGASAGSAGGTGYDPTNRSESAPAGETWTLSGNREGGNGVQGGSHRSAGGGGSGAAGVGSNSRPDGGAGVQINFDGNNWYWAGGGGGAGGVSGNGPGGNGGVGGGGGGGTQSGTGGTGGGTAKTTGTASSGHAAGGAGGANTGGGGGGGSHGDYDGGNGADGIVMIRYKVV